jgi:GAF domain-containing protein
VSTQATLDAICRLAVGAVDGAEHAAVTLVRGDSFTTVAASSDVPALIDCMQYETGQGPCLDAIREHESFMTHDLSKERRWPQFTSRVVRSAGIRSMLAERLFLDSDTLGALNLYAEPTSAFTERSEAFAAMFAAHAAVAYQAARDHDKSVNLEIALHSCRRIGMAMGIVMTREAVTEQQAFEALKRVSQKRNRKLADVADGVIVAGLLER